MSYYYIPRRTGILYSTLVLVPSNLKIRCRRLHLPNQLPLYSTRANDHSTHPRRLAEMELLHESDAFARVGTKIDVGERQRLETGVDVVLAKEWNERAKGGKRTDPDVS